jgi:parvulin-like peptidyl-prolyl isomerase
MAKIKNIIGVVFILSVILVSGCSSQKQPVEQHEQQIIPDDKDTLIDVVATVNGEEITSGEVEEVQQMFAMQGQQVSEEDALEQVIDQKVLSQHAQEGEYAVTDQEAESMIESQLVQQNATLDQYKQQLEMQGIT